MAAILKLVTLVLVVKRGFYVNGYATYESTGNQTQNHNPVGAVVREGADITDIESKQLPQPAEASAPFFPDERPEQSGTQTKRRKKRRKMKRRLPQGGYGLVANPAEMAIANPLYRPLPPPPPRSPPRRRPESMLTSLSNALGSVAKYDDYQCVPRLLCEVASGRDVGSSGGVVGSGSAPLTSFINLQPLITLLASYNGMSSSPLFVFGRAALLGMTSQGNAANCRYAYPSCPSDPNKLLEYLNNYNGGFFRFFNTVNPVAQSGNPIQQGLQQFYNQLSNFNDYNNGYNPNYNNNVNLPNPVYGNYHINNPVSFNGGYGYDNNVYKANGQNENGIIIANNKIQKRIQNSPHQPESNDDENANWAFPTANKYAYENLQTGNFNQATSVEIFKFPTEKIQVNTKHVRTAKGFSFPGTHTNRHYVNYYNYPPVINTNSIIDNNANNVVKTGINFQNNNDYSSQAFEMAHKQGFLKGHRWTNNHRVPGQIQNYNPHHAISSSQSNQYDQLHNDGEIVYVLRGNGDPNNPEIVRLRPGQNSI